MPEYGFILLLISISTVVAILLLIISYFLIPKNYDLEKVSPYECGFDPFSDTRSKYDIRFYLVAILFIIFDLEIIFLFPWAVALSEINFFGFIIMLIFLLL